MIGNIKSVFEFGNEYVCKQFTDIDPDVSGVEIFKNENRLGSIIGLDIPDIDDEEENIKFDANVIEWLVDNDNV